MAVFQAVRKAAEALYEDERLRSNLNDTEAKLVLDWAVSRLDSKVDTAWDEEGAKKLLQEELPRVRSVVLAINQLAMRTGAIRLADAVVAIETVVQGGRAFTRYEIWSILTRLADAAWQIRDIKRG